MTNLYLLALMPPPELSGQIHEIRLECAEKFGVKKALRPPVHITLYRPFHMETAFEQPLIRLLHQAGSALQSFEQELENFGSFNTQVVYINALMNPGLVELHQSIVGVFRKHQIDPKGNKGNHAFHPHLTIAYRDVLPEVFPLIWKEYNDRKFKRSWYADHFTLLKHDQTQWIPLENFNMKAADQPSLF